MRPATPPPRHTRGHGRLVAVDGVNSAAVGAMARSLVAEIPRRRCGISRWDASGVFGDLAVADEEAGRPSARTLLLLYAADLAFRLRWEILPAIEEGRLVVAAPYVATPIAFGRAAGLSPEWLANLFVFAPAPEWTEPAANQAVVKAGHDRVGFVEFSCEQMALQNRASLRDIVDRTRANLLRALGKVKRRKT